MGGSPAENDMSPMLQQLYQQYPGVKGPDWQLLDSRGKQGSGQLEFYSPNESYNPRPGKPTIEVFNQGLQGDALKTAILGDMLHHMPTVDPQFAAGRDAVQNSFTPQQNDFNQRRYQDEQKNQGETRPFPDWMNGSGLDAFVRGYAAPDAVDEWRKQGVYTPAQALIINHMMNSLKRR